MRICEDGIIRELTQEEIVKEQFQQKEAEKEYYQSFSYGELVNMYGRERYTLSEELAVIRQQKEKPKEYKIYYDYFEECKVRAKRTLGIIGDVENE